MSLKTILILVLIVIVFIGILVFVFRAGRVFENIAASEEVARGTIVGGPCEYEWIRGRSNIVSITKTKASRAQSVLKGGAGYEGYDIEFRFTPDKPVKPTKRWTEDAVNGILQKDHTFLLANSWYPGPEYIKKYSISQGAVYPCRMGLITKGTCTPVVFKIDDFDATDYFESGAVRVKVR